ncbi:uncharacterized protein [Ambystoma mexicanum]|uniref:uncharacterized protein isoform X2 n=1 Tax=Ambystoma mexicanum TaxID=8296 RepID=UPI0037E94424
MNACGEEEDGRKLRQFLSDLALLGSLQACCSLQSLESVSLSESLTSSPSGAETLGSPDSSLLLQETPDRLSGPEAPEDIIPPASPCEKEVAVPEENCTLFLLAAYAKYGRPYVWLRSSPRHLLNRGHAGSLTEDVPLKLQATGDWSRKDIRLWDVVSEVVTCCTWPPPLNPLSVDLNFLGSLPLAERYLASGALLHFLRRVLLHGDHDADPCKYIWEEMGHLTSVHFQGLRDLKRENILNTPVEPQEKDSHRSFS